MRRIALLTLAVFASFVGGSLDIRHGDLRYGVNGKTMRHWDIVDVSIDFKPACAFVRSGGGPCGGSGSYTLTGPTSSNLDGSNTYTVQPSGSLSSSVVVTPSDATHHGVFTPTTVTLSGAAAQTFNYAPFQTGTYNISTTNGGGLTNPPPISLTVPNLSPGYPGLVSGWSASNATLNTGVAGDPFGGSNAATLTESATNNYHQLLTSTPISVTSGQSYTLSAIIKQGTGSRNLNIIMIDPTSSAAFYGSFNPSTGGLVASSQWGGANVSSTSSVAVGSWWLIQVSGTLGAFTTANFGFYMDNGPGVVGPYLGDGTSTIDVYGPAVE